MSEPQTVSEREGEFVFDKWRGPPILVVYTVPKGCTRNAQVLIAIHGRRRDVRKAHSVVTSITPAQVIVISPHFPKKDFPDHARFQCGNVMTADSRTNPKEEWAYNVVDAAFLEVKKRCNLETDGYFLYGHSAGAQFVMRFLWFNLDSPVKGAAVANAGWYTMPDPELSWPYGLRGTPLTDEKTLRRICEVAMILCLGEEDTDEKNSLRHTPQADKQGLHRLARGRAFDLAMQALARDLGVECGTTLVLVPNTGHDCASMVDAAVAIFFSEEKQPSKPLTLDYSRTITNTSFSIFSGSNGSKTSPPMSPSRQKSLAARQKSIRAIYPPLSPRQSVRHNSGENFKNCQDRETICRDLSCLVL